MIYGHTETHIVLWTLLPFYNWGGCLWSTAGSPLSPFFFFFKVCRYSIRRSKGKREVGLAVTTITSLYLWPSADFKELPSCVSFAFSSGRVFGWLLWAVVLFYFVVSLFISRFLFYFVVVSSRFCYFTAFPLCVSRLYYCLRRPD